MGSHWLPSEDLQMCISFARCSLDEINDNKQKREKLWESIHADYVLHWKIAPGEIPPHEPRSQIALSCHYNKLKRDLQKWGEALQHARNRVASGTSLMDEGVQAQSFYYAAKKKQFTHFACYEAIKDHPSYVTVLPSTPSYFASNSDYTPSPPPSSPFINLGDEEPNEPPQSYMATPSSPPRPIGVKAAKEARRRKKQGKSSVDNREQIMHSIASDQETWHRKREMHNENQLACYKEYIEIQKRKEIRADEELQLKKQNDARAAEELQLKKQEEETRIMTMDLASMTPISKRYFTKRKLAILKASEEGEGSEDQNTEDPYEDCYRPYSRVLFP